MTTKNQDELFGTAPIRRILLKTAPPVMLAQLIQALYNIVDSFFVGKYSTDALTALTVIYPLQLIIIALAVGTGVGTNTYMANTPSTSPKKQTLPLVRAWCWRWPCGQYLPLYQFASCNPMSRLPPLLQQPLTLL